MTMLMQKPTIDKQLYSWGTTKYKDAKGKVFKIENTDNVDIEYSGKGRVHVKQPDADKYVPATRKGLYASESASRNTIYKVNKTLYNTEYNISSNTHEIPLPDMNKKYSELAEDAIQRGQLSMTPIQIAQMILSTKAIGSPEQIYWQQIVGTLNQLAIIEQTRGLNDNELDIKAELEKIIDFEKQNIEMPVAPVAPVAPLSPGSSVISSVPSSVGSIPSSVPSSVGSILSSVPSSVPSSIGSIPSSVPSYASADYGDVYSYSSGQDAYDRLQELEELRGADPVWQGIYPTVLNRLPIAIQELEDLRQQSYISDVGQQSYISDVGSSLIGIEPPDKQLSYPDEKEVITYKEWKQVQTGLKYDSPYYMKIVDVRYLNKKLGIAETDKGKIRFTSATMERRRLFKFLDKNTPEANKIKDYIEKGVFNKGYNIKDLPDSFFEVGKKSQTKNLKIELKNLEEVLKSERLNDRDKRTIVKRIREIKREIDIS
jgi:hypothetical protein